MLLSVVKVKILSANYSAEKNIREATGEVIKELNTGNISAHLYSLDFILHSIMFRTSHDSVLQQLNCKAQMALFLFSEF